MSAVIKQTGKRARLYRQDPHCYWCGILTVLDTGFQPHSATIDHLYSRVHPNRNAPRGNDRSELLHVLSCLQCNQERGKADQHGRMFTPKLAKSRETARRYAVVTAVSAQKTISTNPPPLPPTRKQLTGLVEVVPPRMVKRRPDWEY